MEYEHGSEVTTILGAEYISSLHIFQINFILRDNFRKLQYEKS